jgi:hypothetical protein
MGTGGSFPGGGGGLSGRGVKLTTHLQLVAEVKKAWLHNPLSANVHGAVLNYVVKQREKITFFTVR